MAGVDELASLLPSFKIEFPLSTSSEAAWKVPETSKLKSWNGTLLLAVPAVTAVSKEPVCSIPTSIV